MKSTASPANVTIGGMHAAGVDDTLPTLALISDPARLGPVATRVMEVAPTFLDWRDQEFATPEEAAAAYIQSGASGFDTNMTSFRNAVLLTVANRLDAVLSIMDRINR